MLDTKPIPINILTTYGGERHFIFGPRTQALLQEPFGPEALKKRVMRTSKKGDKAEMAYYIDLRDMTVRLDEIVGPNNWSNSLNAYNGGDRIIITASMDIGGTSRTGESEEVKNQLTYRTVTKKVTKQWTDDKGVTYTEVTDVPVIDPRDSQGKKFLQVRDLEQPKELVALRAGPNASKRAAVLYGLGAYLYKFKDINTWEEIDKWKQPKNPNINFQMLPDWAKPTPGPLLVLRELGNLIGVEVGNLQGLPKGEQDKLQDALKTYWGLESVRDLSSSDCMRLTGCMARIGDWLSTNPKDNLNRIYYTSRQLPFLPSASDEDPKPSAQEDPQ